MTRRAAVLAWLSAPLVLAACQPKSTPGPVPPPPQEVQREEAAAGMRIAVVPKAVTHQFWTTVKAGAEAAGTELGASIEWKGPDNETDVEAQKTIIQDFVTRRVRAIVMAACDADGLVSDVQAAEQAGIPVITIDSGLNWPEVRCLVSTDNVAAARVAGETLFGLLGGQGKVGLIPFVKGAASSEDREKGFREAVAAAPGIELGPVLYSDSDVGKAKDVTNDMLTREPDLAGIFAANEAGAIGAANALAEAGRKGKVKLVGFDGSPDEERLLREGVLQALVVQNPYKMGYEGVRLALEAIQGRQVPKRVDTGVVVVTAENVDSGEVRQLLHPTDTK